MSFQRKIMATSLAVVFAAGGMYTLEVYRRTGSTPSNQILHASASESFTQSETVRRLVNPRQYAAVSDSHRYAFRLPAQSRHLSDEALLTKFVRGYFGGLVFAPERCALKAYGKPLVSFTEATPTRAIWSTAELSDTELPPLHSVLFGAFQVIEKQVASQSDNNGDSTESSIYLGFGNDQSQFVGTHRFAITRQAADRDNVEVVYESVACNPIVDRPMNSVLKWFHNGYTQLLFSDALFGLRKSLSESYPSSGSSNGTEADTADGRGPDS